MFGTYMAITYDVNSAVGFGLAHTYKTIGSMCQFSKVAV